MDEIKLRRQVYHSAALVVNNVNKLTKNENITKISRVFTLSLVKLSDGSDKEFSSSDKAVKMRTLLTKFKQCYDLYSVSRPLCRHEVAFLSIRCASLGSWFTEQFPSTSIIPNSMS